MSSTELALFIRFSFPNKFISRLQVMYCFPYFIHFLFFHLLLLFVIVSKFLASLIDVLSTLTSVVGESCHVLLSCSLLQVMLIDLYCLTPS